MQYERKKLKFHGTRHCINSFFCQKIWEMNDVWMLQNMTPLKTDITELSINKKETGAFMYTRNVTLKKNEVCFVSQV